MDSIIEENLLRKLILWSKELKRTKDIPFNPMSEFVPYVSTKEIVHTFIIYELLNPLGSHGYGDKFLKMFFTRFLPKLKYDDLSDINVTRERKVYRVLTKGGVRSIDILIDYRDSHGDNHAIIIENKLNHAEFQYLQIEDYTEGLVREGFKVDNVIVLHDRYQSADPSNKSGFNITIYPDLLSEWIKSVDVENHGIIAYADYLMLLHNQNIPYENSTKMLNCTLQEIQDLYKLKQAFENLTKAKNNYILEQISQEFPNDFKIESTFSKLDQGCKMFQLWNQKDYEANGLWIAVYPPTNPVDEKGEPGTDVYIYCHDNKAREASAIAAKLGCSVIGSGDGYTYFKKPGEASRYTFFDKESRKKLIEEIVRLLKGLHKS